MRLLNGRSVLTMVVFPALLGSWAERGADISGMSSGQHVDGGRGRGPCLVGAKESWIRTVRSASATGAVGIRQMLVLIVGGYVITVKRDDRRLAAVHCRGPGGLVGAGDPVRTHAHARGDGRCHRRGPWSSPPVRITSRSTGDARSARHRRWGGAPAPCDARGPGGEAGPGGRRRSLSGRRGRGALTSGAPAGGAGRCQKVGGARF